MEKEIELKKYKRLATGLFILMGITFLSMLYAIQVYDASWMYYVKAFSEAAMVGALADWFAVTALFRYPMGLRIPHTNLIESNKNKIGSNLGDFVTDNFLTSTTIRPYIEALNVSKYVLLWLDKPGTIALISKEINRILLNVLQSVDEDKVTAFAQKQLEKNLSKIPFAKLISQGIQFALENNEQDKVLNSILPEIREYILNNQSLIYKRVVEKQPLLGLIGGKSVTNQLIDGLLSFLSDVEENTEHPIRIELKNKINLWAEEVEKDPNWQDKFVHLIESYMNPETTQGYLLDMWTSIRSNVKEQLTNSDSAIQNYIKTWLESLKKEFRSDVALQSKINSWVQYSLYRLILKNTKELSSLIERTVANWDGKELSNKLELEVGKDLQFIRVNGTMVGGLVGLLIYIITHFFL